MEEASPRAQATMTRTAAIARRVVDGRPVGQMDGPGARPKRPSRGSISASLLVHGVDLARTHHRPLDVPYCYLPCTACCWRAARSRPSCSPRGVVTVPWCSAGLHAAILPISSHRARQARSGSRTTATDASTHGSVVRPRTSSWRRTTDDSARSPAAPDAAPARPAPLPQPSLGPRVRVRLNLRRCGVP